MRRVATVLFIAAIAFICGYSAAGLKKPPAGAFHDMIVNYPRDLQTLVTPDDRTLRALAADLETPENAFAYVRDRIAFDPSLPALPAGQIISERRASCLGKAILLCSLYRAMGFPPQDVRIVTGEVDYSGSVVDHAWVEIEYYGVCLQQDASGFLGLFAFDHFHGQEYTRSFIRRESYVFNDRHFAVVSQLNLIKGMGHPPVQ